MCIGSSFLLSGGGAGNALGNNLTLGAIPRDHWSNPAFVQGQRFGDGLSVGLGAAETYMGRGMMGDGGLMMIGSGGALMPVATPFAASGAAMTAHGSVVMGKALLECKGKDGRHEGEYVKTPPGNLNKLKGNQGWRDKKGNIWKKDMKHKDHWDVVDPKTGKKIKEIDFNGNQIWPQGAKNKGKR